MSEEEKKVHARELSDVEELKAVLKAISDFIASLKGPLKELMDTIMSSLDGSKLGEEVSALYKKLIDSGMPEDMVNEMVKTYFKHKLESAVSPKTISEFFRRFMEKPKRARIAVSTEDLDRIVELLEEVKKSKPEISDKIDKVIATLKKGREEKKKEEK